MMIILPLLLYMNGSDCYRILGLQPNDPYDVVRASYRRLVRLYHPDINPGNQAAEAKFLEVTAAYQFLRASLSQQDLPPPTSQASQSGDQPPVTSASSRPATRRDSGVRVNRKSPAIQFNPTLSQAERQMKAESYRQLQGLLRHRRYPRAVALVDGLASRFPQDPEIHQWQAIAYQQWGRQLIRDRQFEKARLLLKKALKTDPHNRTLWSEVEKDFRQLEQFF